MKTKNMFAITIISLILFASTFGSASASSFDTDDKKDNSYIAYIIAGIVGAIITGGCALFAYGKLSKTTPVNEKVKLENLDLKDLNGISEKNIDDYNLLSEGKTPEEKAVRSHIVEDLKNGKTPQVKSGVVVSSKDQAALRKYNLAKSFRHETSSNMYGPVVSVSYTI